MGWITPGFIISPHDRDESEIIGSVTFPDDRIKDDPRSNDTTSHHAAGQQSRRLLSPRDPQAALELLSAR